MMIGISEAIDRLNDLEESDESVEDVGEDEAIH